MLTIRTVDNSTVHGLRKALFLGFLLAITACSDSASTNGNESGPASQTGSDNSIGATIDESPELLVEEAVARIRREAANDPVDPCDLARNWQYHTLHVLSRAVELDSDTALAMIDSESVGDVLHTLGITYEKWRLAVPGHWDAATLTELMTDREWWPYQSSLPPSWIETQADGSVTQVDFLEEETILGTWTIQDDSVLVSLDSGEDITLRPKSVRYAFDQGNSWFYVATLEIADAAMQVPWGNPLVVGPPAGDCGEYNF